MLQRTAILTIAACLALPGAAAASTTVANDGATTRITGDADADAVVVTLTYLNTGPVSGDALRITNAEGVVPGPGCVPEGTASVVCPRGAGGVDADLGAGGDSFRFDEYDCGASGRGGPARGGCGRRAHCGRAA